MFKWRKKPNYIQKRRNATRMKESREDYKRDLGSIDRIANALESTKTQEQADDDKRALRENITICLLIFTVIFTGLADFIFYWTLQDAHTNAENQVSKMTEASALTRESNQINRDAIAASNRAWVGPSDVSIVGDVSQNTPINFNISIFNTGREPAKSFTKSFDIISDRVVFDIEMNNYVNECFSTIPNEQAQVLYPSSGFSGGGISFSPTLAANKVSASVINGDIPIIVRGCLTYQTSGQTKHSAFCYFYKGGLTKSEHLNVCENGSDAE